jgi:glycosyltransferase involved in cell wall biosynthesis
MERVSIIIPTFNRFSFLLNTIRSIKLQTYDNIEIIVVNDCSTENEYYEYKWKDNEINIIHLETNSKNIFGFACAAYVRNKGIEISSGKYIAFCDDDDIWFPSKIELQLNAMKKTGCKMSSTDGLIGNGVYDSNTVYKKYNAEHYFNTLKNIYKEKNSNFLDNGFPEIWDIHFLKIHNCMICSSVLMEKDILDKINNFKHDKTGSEDYNCWLRALEYTNSVYIQDVCFYYDSGHGHGQNY